MTRVAIAIIAFALPLAVITGEMISQAAHISAMDGQPNATSTAPGE